MNWQGSYTGLLFCCFNPLIFGALEALPAILMIVIFLFFASLLFFTRAVVRKLLGIEKWSVILWFFLGITVLCSQFRDPKELFYWYTGAAAYTLPLVFSFTGLGAYVYSLFSSRTKARPLLTIISCIFLFFACGGSLGVGVLTAGMLCGSTFFLLLAKEERWKRSLIFLGIAVLAVAINAFAPGNFVRQNAIPSATHHNIFKTLALTVVNTLSVCVDGSALPTAICVGILLFLLVHRQVQGLSYGFRYPGLVSFLSLLLLVACIFAHTLGTGADVSSGRYIFLTQLFEWILVIMNVIYWGGWIVHQKRFLFTPAVIAPVLISILLAFFTVASDFPITHFNACRILDGFVSGAIQSHKEETDRVLWILERFPSKDIEIRPEAAPFPLLKAINLSWDKTYWENQDTAKYFHKDSIRIILE